MPLLMIDTVAPPPPTSSIEIEAGAARIIRFGAGQLLTIETLEAGRVAALFAFRDEDPAEFLSPHHTRVFGGSFLMRMGTRLVTNRRRPMFVVGRDSLRVHDLLMPASDATLRAVVAEVDLAGHVVPRVPDPINLFADVRLSMDGTLVRRPGPARAGERVTLRALMDGVAVVAAVEAAEGPPVVHGLRAATYDHVTDLPVDLPVKVTE